MSETGRSVLSPATRASAVPTDSIWRLSVKQYHAMIDNGILTDDDPVELLEGWLVAKIPKNPAHRVVTRLIRQALERLMTTAWYVDSQEPITLEDSEPEPDVMVVRGETRRYLDRHPGPPDVALLVEVADTTLQRDRTLKKRLYARAGIPVYWLMNLSENLLEVYTNPSPASEYPDYRQRRDYGPSDTVPVVIEAAEIGRITVRKLLP